MSDGPLILVVDDEPSIRRVLRVSFERAAYRVLEANNAGEAVCLAGEVRPSAIILDLTLPDADGIDVIPRLKAKCDAAIIVVSARSGTVAKINALDRGATDYLTKPFDTVELLARLRAAMRHLKTDAGPDASIQIDDLYINLKKRRVLKRGVEVDLTPKEFAAVAELSRSAGRAVPHAQLVKAIWTRELRGHISHLRILVRKLREKIEDDPSRPRLLLSEFGVGYRLGSAARHESDTLMVARLE
jgi:two-component system KDP operon response regulator KdpE